MKIKITNAHGEALTLKRAHLYDAGIDIPVSETIFIDPGVTEVIGAGVYVEIPKGFAGMLISRSSAARRGLLVHMSPIDHGYTGEIHIIVTNTSNVPQIIYNDQSVAQLVVFPIVLIEPIEEEETMRGDGAFGSTNKV